MTKWGIWHDTYQPQVRVKLTFGARCLCCRHFTGNGRCEAYPYGIPREILTGDHDHTKPYPGDGGITWESILHEVPP